MNKINKDRWIFIGCVVVATTFWAMQKLSNNYKFIQRYSVRYTIPNGKVFKRQPTSTVEVTLVGLGWDIVTKSAKNIGDKIEVELSADNNQLIPSSAIAEKINSAQPIRVCGLDEIDMLITELPANDPLLKPYIDAGVRVA